MNQFVLQHNKDPELRLFPHILQIGAVKNSAICLNGFPASSDHGLKIYYVQEGKYEWTIGDRSYILYPGDVAIVLPKNNFGNLAGVLEIGSFCWVHLKTPDPKKKSLIAGSWSNMSPAENQAICKILQRDQSPVLQKFTEAGVMFKHIQAELFNQEICYQTRVNHLLDEFLIQIARQFTRISNSGRDFPATFMKLEQELRRNLSHQWTVEEMATMVGLGTTLFNEKVKSYSGFTPQSYLINIRISEAIKLLKKPEISLTDIALETGFYSSQHFSTTFKKLTGYTPSQFRKNYFLTT